MEARTKTRGTFVAAIAVAALTLAGVIALAGCSAAPAGSEDTSMSDRSNAYAKITADEAKALMDSGSPTIVDVRTAQEYADRHLPGAINIPVESIGSDKPAELVDTDAELIVYCRTGVRSKQASDKLVELGYRHVNDMGGIVDWKGGTVAGDQPGSM